ncbi:hypothetical protein QAD02_023613 [Eretmocerus hayati]|uniref:Uncharacterized protein n=1 Tax=Eretmocerus hayati TaxID=131215 RepID=A0ACC2PW42_9HYME|nr:hypothetical protein QAD02_023613 [Eretmocerus hayati]
MLTLTEPKHKQSGESKNQKNKRRRKQVLNPIDKNVKKDDVKEQLQLPELVSVEDASEQCNVSHITFQDSQGSQSVATLSGVEAIPNNNKYVIITLLDPNAHQIAGANFSNATALTSGSDEQTNCVKLDENVILLHNIEAQSVTTNDVIPQAPNTVKIIKEDPCEDAGVIINFGTSASSTEESDGQNIENWINQFPSLQLLHTECGRSYVKCPACTAMFFKAALFEKHVTRHLHKVNEQLICNFCNYKIENPNNMFDHLHLHQDQCEVCNMNLTRRNNFQKHWENSDIPFSIKRDRWGRFLCTYCKLGFDLSHQLQKHWYKHSCKAQKIVQCNGCCGLFETDEALQNHLCLKCPVCGKICDSVHRLRSHTRYEKHYLYCQICSYEFILAIDHEKHMALHKKTYHPHKDYANCLQSEDGVSFQCEVCGKIYHTMSSLVLHIHDDHSISEANQNLEPLSLNLCGAKDETPYDIITSLRGDLKCDEVDFELTCNEVLET